MKYTILFASTLFCLVFCACKKHKDSTPASRLPASFTGMKTWHIVGSTQTYYFAVTTSGKDEVAIDGNVLEYQSTDSLNTGYTLKYQGSGNGTSAPGNGQSYANFIHAVTGDTIYYTTIYQPMGRPSVTTRYVTP